MINKKYIKLKDAYLFMINQLELSEGLTQEILLSNEVRLGPQTNGKVTIVTDDLIITIDNYLKKYLDER